MPTEQGTQPGPEIVCPLARRVGLLCRTIEEDAIARDGAGRYLIVERTLGTADWRPWDGEGTTRFTDADGARADYAWRMAVAGSGPYGDWQDAATGETCRALRAPAE